MKTLKKICELPVTITTFNGLINRACNEELSINYVKIYYLRTEIVTWIPLTTYLKFKFHHIFNLQYYVINGQFSRYSIIHLAVSKSVILLVTLLHDPFFKFSPTSNNWTHYFDSFKYFCYGAYSEGFIYPDSIIYCNIHSIDFV